MITTRSGFEEAIRNKMPQRALVTFPALPLVFTSEDIAANGGIEIEEILNGTDDLEIGKAVESMASVTLLNDAGLLSSVDLTGEFVVSLGVKIAEGDAYSAVRTAGATLAVGIVEGGYSNLVEAVPGSTNVYINGSARSAGGQPKALIARGSDVYVIGSNGLLLKTLRFSGNSASEMASELQSDFMLAKCKQWADDGKCVHLASDGTLREYTVVNGQIVYDLWEYVPLGHFVGNRPDKVKTRVVALTGYDLMQRFDQPAYEYFDMQTYPATMGTLFANLCEYCEVAVGDTSAALNMSKFFSSAPIDNDSSTCREVLAYIAEAAGCYARISRDGKCELVWFGDVDYTLNRTDYFSIDEAEYVVPKIDKLQSHVTNDDIGVIVGNGTNGYDIIDNPYLNGATDAEARPWVTNIYNRLAAFDEYSPISVDCECNWALQCGDIITVVTTEGNKQLPIFAQSIYWSGNARATLQSTGEQSRSTMTATNREKLVNGRNYFELSKSVEGMSLNITSIQDVANEAKNTANAASTAAGNAQATANSAQSAANAASTAAGNAQATANSAQSAASNAQSTANAASAGVTTLTDKVNKVEAKVTPEAIVTTVTESSTYKTDLQNTQNNAVESANNATDQKLAGYTTTVDMDSAIRQSAESVSSSVNKTLEDYSTTEQMNSAIDQSAERVKTTVSETYSTKSEAQGYANAAEENANNSTNAKLQNYSTTEQTATKIETAIASISVGGRNLIRNSENLMFENYYFTGALVVTHDGAGNVTVVSGASAFAGEDGHVTIKTAASVSHDGAGNVTIAG